MTEDGRSVAGAEPVSSRCVTCALRATAHGQLVSHGRARACKRAAGRRVGHLSGSSGGAPAGAPGGPAGEDKTTPRDAVGRERHGAAVVAVALLFVGAPSYSWCGRCFRDRPTKRWTPKIWTKSVILARKNNAGRNRLKSQGRSEFSADFKSVEKRFCPLRLLGVNTRNDRPLIYEKWLR